MEIVKKASLGSNLTGSYIKKSAFRSLSIIYDEAFYWAQDVVRTSVLDFFKDFRSWDVNQMPLRLLPKRHHF